MASSSDVIRAIYFPEAHFSKTSLYNTRILRTEIIWAGNVTV